MSQYLLPEKVRIVNDSSRFTATYLDAAGAATTAAAAVEVSVYQYGKTKTSQVKRVQIIRGLAPQKPKYSVTAATAAQITIGTPVTGQKVYFEFKLESSDRQFLLARPEYEFGSTRVYEIVLTTGDTAGNILYKLYDAINSNSEVTRLNEPVLKASVGTGGTLGSGTLDIISFDVQLDNVYISSFRATGEDSLTSTYVTVWSPVVATEFVAPKGRGKEVEFREKMQAFNNTPYYKDFDEIPIHNAYYTMVAWEIAISRTPIAPYDLSSTVRHAVFLNESTCSSIIDNLCDFFLTTPSTRLTALETIAGVVVGFNDAEAITTAANAAATEIDSTDYSVTYVKGQASGTAAKYLLLEALANPADAEGNATVLSKVKTNA